ncbi:Nucleotide-binding universal stress protein, UspA family [Formivibrio citricus]|uniref:Universal stress protein n=1 Tax=Formivibrio citricus TaxID=83765 RepID=A0A1I4WI83_9NEIS|nr:universal stress protein [Formivibrio citricus]SFN13137.1 Nucleotide-binding universal stress protein, UspA family [Formivibrio citricus]
MYQRIFVPVGADESSACVVEEASRLAAALHARICLAQVVDTSQFADDPLELAHELRLSEAEREHDDRRAALHRSLEARAQPLQAAGIETDTRLVEKFGGKICDAIVKAAADWKADLIVMGTHGRGGIRHFLMGSVAEGVLHHTRIPILLVHDTSDDD